MTSFQNSATPHNDVPMGNRTIESIIMCTIIVVCIVGNVALWIVVLRIRALRSVTSMFILGLSSADMLVATVNMPVTMYTLIVGFWPFSNQACVAIGYLNMFTLVCSVLSLCNISINRYFMVCKATKFQRIYNTKNAVFMIIAVVTISAVLSSLPLIGWSDYVYTPRYSLCFADWANHMSYALFMISCCFGLPFAVMTVCNILIIRSVRDSKRKLMSSVRPTRNSVTVNISQNEAIGYQFRTNQVDNSKYNEQCNLKVLNEKCAALRHENNKKETDSMQHEKKNAGLHIDKVEQNMTDDNTNSTSMQCMHIERNNSFNLAWKQHSSLSKVSWNNLLIQKDVDSSEGIFAQPETSVSKISWLKYEHKIQVDKYARYPNSEAKHIPGSQINSSFSSRERSVSTKRNNNNNAYKRTAGVQRRETLKLRRSEEIHLAFSLTIVVVLFVICWLPYCISMAISIFYKGHVPREFDLFALIIGYVNSGCNPIVYGLMNQRFKLGFKTLFCFWRSKNLSITLSNSDQVQVQD